MRTHAERAVGGKHSNVDRQVGRRRFPVDYAPRRRDQIVVIVRAPIVLCKCDPTGTPDGISVVMKAGAPNKASDRAALRSGEAVSHGRCSGCARLFLQIPKHGMGKGGVTSLIGEAPDRNWQRPGRRVRRP